MLWNKGHKILTAGFFTCLLLSACTSGADDKPKETFTEIPEIPTSTDIQPSITPTTTETTIVVSFDGENCLYSGPEVIEEGWVVVELKNLTDNPNVYVYPVRLLDGKTWEDILDYYSEADGFTFIPSWVDIDTRRSVPGNPNALAYEFIPGQYVVICSHLIPEGEQAFPGAPFEVKPASSD